MQHPFSIAATRDRVGGPQLHSLTILRGIAAWWVVAFHFEDYIQPYVSTSVFKLMDKGYLAVDLFFCLSGFVIFLNYRQLKFTRARVLGIFYFKRLAKIYPLHLFTICLYALLLGALKVANHDIPGERFSLKSLLLNLLLVQDWGTPASLSWNIPSWSISAEFAAYLLFPLVILIIKPAAARISVSALMIFALLFLLNSFYAFQDFDLGRAIGTLGVLRCVTEFTIGAILAQMFTSGTITHRLLSPSLFFLAVIFLLTGLNTLGSVLIPLGCAALVFALARTDRKVAHRNHSWLVFVGEISYATYMLHYFIRDLFKLTFVRAHTVTPLYDVLAALIVIFVASIPLYLLVERPAQQWLISRAVIKSLRVSEKTEMRARKLS